MIIDNIQPLIPEIDLKKIKKTIQKWSKEIYNDIRQKQKIKDKKNITKKDKELSSKIIIKKTKKKDAKKDKESPSKIIIKKTKKKGEEEKKVQKVIHQNQKLKQIIPDKWLMPNKKGFINWLNTTFSEYRLKGPIQNDEEPHIQDSSSGISLFPYQKLIKDYLNNRTPYRGLLLYHGLGAGKTCASIAVAEGFKNSFPVNEIIVMLPASLKSNFIGELKHCGDPLWKLTQYWGFLPVSNQEINSISEKYSMSKQIIRKNKGIWLCDPKRDNNYGELSDMEKKQINEQIDYYIDQKYSFIHYNGIQNKKLDDMEMEEINPFDNKVIIIDEVHNLISRAIGGGTGSRLYKLLMDAQNIRLVLLSGTPLINYPYESALLLNLLRGYIYEFHIQISNDKKIKNWNEKINNLLREIKSIDQIFIDDKNKMVRFTRNPYLFENIYEKENYDGFIIENNNSQEMEDFFQMVTHEVLQLGFNIKKTNIEKYLALPEKEKLFNEFFIDNKNNRVKNQDLFIRRILGTISYYRGARADLFPQSSGIIPVKVPMSDYQFQKYESIRQVERKKEKKKTQNKKKKKEGDKQIEGDNISSYYRVFSRAFGNFVFPEIIDRPLPGIETKKGKEKEINLSDSISDVDETFDGEEKISQKTKNLIYEKEKEIAMTELEDQSQIYLTPGEEGLNKYSPKFLMMLENINQSSGSVFVYSQFRSLEGIGIFSLVLKTNGYAPFRLRKDEQGRWEIYEEEDERDKPKYAFYSGTEEEEYKNIIKNIFNNDLDKLTPNIRDYIIQNKGDNLRGNVIKVLLATASAAEGISLANVRQVHITEPYWNPVRIEQVMGRAIRIGSHKQLPPEERNVEVFLYISTFTKEQLASSFTIKTQDKSLTSDEAIYDIALRKKQITGDLFRLMKESSIDCTLNSTENEPINCFSFGSRVKKDENAYVPNIDKDTIERFEQEKVKINAIKIRYPPKTGKIYILNKDNNEVYDYGSWKTASEKGGNPILVGKFMDNETGGEIEIF